MTNPKIHKCVRCGCWKFHRAYAAIYCAMCRMRQPGRIVGNTYRTEPNASTQILTTPENPAVFAGEGI